MVRCNVGRTCESCCSVSPGFVSDIVSYDISPRFFSGIVYCFPGLLVLRRGLYTVLITESNTLCSVFANSFEFESEEKS